MLRRQKQMRMHHIFLKNTLHCIFCIFAVFQYRQRQTVQHRRITVIKPFNRVFFSRHKPRNTVFSASFCNTHQRARWSQKIFSAIQDTSKKLHSSICSIAVIIA